MPVESGTINTGELPQKADSVRIAVQERGRNQNSVQFASTHSYHVVRPIGRSTDLGGTGLRIKA